MDNDLNEKIESAIAKAADQVKAQPDGQKALHFSQSALNLAHTRAVLEGIKSPYATKKSS
jgi:hypothetical protein